MSILNECTLTPAYGRDYKSLKEAQKDFDEGKDFRLNHFSGSTYCSIRDFQKGGVEKVKLRYSKRTKIGILIAIGGES